MDMQFARDLLEVRAEKVEYTGYEPQAITALSKVVLELVKENDNHNRIMPVDVVQLNPGLYRLQNSVSVPVEDARNFKKEVTWDQDLQAEYYEACMWMGYRRHKPYSTCGTGNVVQRAYELGWEGPIIRKDKKK